MSQQSIKTKADIMNTTLLVISISISIIAIITMFYTWIVVSEVQAANRKYAKVFEFENRLVQKLDDFNYGIQTLNRKTNSDLNRLALKFNNVSLKHNKISEQIESATDNMEIILNSNTEELAVIMDRRIEKVVENAISRHLSRLQNTKPRKSLSPRPVTSKNRSVVPFGYSRKVDANGQVRYSKSR